MKPRKRYVKLNDGRIVDMTFDDSDTPLVLTNDGWLPLKCSLDQLFSYTTLTDEEAKTLGLDL